MDEEDRAIILDVVLNPYHIITSTWLIFDIMMHDRETSTIENVGVALEQ